MRKRKGGLPSNELEQVNAALSEYDQRMLMHVSTSTDVAKKDEGLDFLVCDTEVITKIFQLNKKDINSKLNFIH